MSAVVTVGAWEAHYAAGRGFRPVMSNEQHTFERHVGPAAAAGLTALDIGCGTGEFAHYLTTCGYDVLGVDCAATAISRATNRYSDTANLSFRCWDAENEQWDDLPQFSVITTRLSYAFIKDKTEYLKRVRTHLAPGGHFHVMTPRREKLPPERRNTGINETEVTDLCAGWAHVKRHELDCDLLVSG